MNFPQKTVYLVGPISGLSYGEARHGWREEASELLPAHIHPHSPMRGKDFLFEAGCITGDPSAYPDQVIATPKGIITRDENDVRNCDAILACFLGADKASIGSCVEFGMARILRKPVIMVVEKDGTNPHWHAFLTEIAGYITDDIGEAVHILSHVLTPGV